MNETSQQHANRRLVGKLSIVVLGMFGFGFALVPLYSVICDAFGLNGRFLEIERGEYDAQAQADRAASPQMVVDKNRLVTVEFLANRNQNLAWEFRPEVSSIKVHPGEVTEVKFYAKNLSAAEITAQAVPSVSPGTASKYFSKIECFCFTQQKLESGQGREMPLRFFVAPDLPKKVSTISLSYTFFATENKQASKADVTVQQDKVHLAAN